MSYTQEELAKMRSGEDFPLVFQFGGTKAEIKKQIFQVSQIIRRLN